MTLAVARDAAEKQKALPKQGFLVFGGESGTRKIAVEHFNRNYVSP
ncbi:MULTISPECIES: hypothetical protein [Ralstonia]|jgi:hypothetical protein|nr:MULTISPECIES: hypothetical protein [Ralstonia]MBX4002322.1 hypothetical protein [Ralstonia pickettii]MBX4029324.1 hypothetical protein [Ralstonia pickettii]MBX4070852.1 hypothetical protein [Ralstonia pickettii]MBX4075972.1 hypothetical protein [Ralstonia pickettii]MBX4088814.1 hypothetical protein [Ralstonia pickettii]